MAKVRTDFFARASAGQIQGPVESKQRDHGTQQGLVVFLRRFETRDHGETRRTERGLGQQSQGNVADTVVDYRELVHWSDLCVRWLIGVWLLQTFTMVQTMGAAKRSATRKARPLAARDAVTLVMADLSAA